MSARGNLQGRVALVTGGARRIGAAICRELAAQGASVVVQYLHSEKESIGMNHTLGQGVFSVRGDLSTPQGCEWVFREAADWMGRVDILVNNAAVFGRDGQMDLAELQAVNVAAPQHLARMLADQPTGGCVVQMLDSRIAWPATGEFQTYTATKREVADSVVSLARAWAPRVRVNGVAPGPVLVPEGVREAAGELPLGRRPTVEDVAQAVVFLCKSQSITGQILFVDGGQHLRQQ
ncbi:MAG: SDR family oxidoreductase [Kiritimatiellia bacterium]|jgi:NAD(P)-dependent dehydrogenase (short-subunit alcohol dehydrogenase family)|nr:SDR family oxidoreductase [Kiritimatiellia bacterium]